MREKGSQAVNCPRKDFRFATLSPVTSGFISQINLPLCCPGMESQSIFYQGCQSNLEQPHFQVQQYVRDTFWPQSKSSLAQYASYFKYFQWTIALLSWPQGVADTRGFAIQKYGDLARFILFLKQGIDHDRLSILKELEDQFPDCTRGQILRSVDLAIRLWLNLYVRTDDFSTWPCPSDATEIEWRENLSLREMIKGAFPSSQSLIDQEVLIDPSFTAENLHKMCRVRIKWTANLKDHLMLERSTATLHLFPHKICLISHLESCNVLPKELVVETLRTLDLLFPPGKESTYKFLELTGQNFYRISSGNNVKPIDFGEFQYWRKRLLDLHNVFVQAPTSISQMWYDRRNPLQWWTFWLAGVIATLTVIFGVIASYTGFKQVALAEKAYQLSLSQACSQEKPPEICIR